MARLFDGMDDYRARQAQSEAEKPPGMREALTQAWKESLGKMQTAARENYLTPGDLLYDSPLQRAVAGALNDIFRKVIEVPTWGEQFDGRFYFDTEISVQNEAGNDNRSIDGMGETYDHRAAYFGHDAAQENTSDRGQAQENEMER